MVSENNGSPEISQVEKPKSPDELAKKIEDDLQAKGLKAKCMYSESARTLTIGISLVDILEPVKQLDHSIYLKGRVLMIKLRNIGE